MKEEQNSSKPESEESTEAEKSEKDKIASGKETVTLNGSPAEKEGYHTLFFGGRVITFENGSAEVAAAVATQLREVGYVE